MPIINIVKRNKFFSAIIFIAMFFCAQNIFAQEETEEIKRPLISFDYQKPETAKMFFKQLRFVLAGAPTFKFNSIDTKTAAATSLVFPLTIGAHWSNNYFVTIEPRLSLYTQYYIWNNSKKAALPTEIENRTAMVLEFMLDLPVVFTLQVSKKTDVEFFIGPAFLFRGGFLASGIQSGDSGTSGSAGSDVKEINKWFWDNGRWFYFSLGASWMIHALPHLTLGPEIHLYLPIGSFASSESFNEMTLSLGIKVMF